MSNLHFVDFIGLTCENQIVPVCSTYKSEYNLFFVS